MLIGSTTRLELIVALSGDFIVTSGSLTHIVKTLKDGDDRAAEEAFQVLYERSYRWLVAVARKTLDGTQRRVADEEDAAMSGLAAFFRGVRENRFPNLHNRKNLASLLLTITQWKAINQRDHLMARKRGGGRVRGDSVLGNGDTDDQAGVQPQDPEPSPATTAEFCERIDYMYDLLDDDTLRHVAVMKLEGYTNAEIAKKLGKVERTVERKVRRIKRLWSELQDEG